MTLVFYPQQMDKFFTEIKNWFSFVRPLYPDIHWDFHWSIRESLLEFIAAE